MRARGIPTAEQGIDMDSQQPAPLHFIFQNYSHLSVCAENCQPITQAHMQAEGRPVRRAPNGCGSGPD